MTFSTPDIPKPQVTPQAPTEADASVVEAGLREQQRYASLVGSAGAAGQELKRKAKTEKASLVG